MNKSISLILVLFLSLAIVSPALAGGGGPPKDFKKGIFTAVNPVERTAEFRESGSEKTVTLLLGQALQPDDIKVDRKVMISLAEKDGHQFVKDVSIMFMGLTLQKIIALLLIGLIGGLLSGFIGSGGAFVLTPAMMSLGAPGAVAVASNMCHKFPKAMVGAYKRFKYGQADIKLGLVMAASAIAGVQIGIKIQKFILDAWGNAGSNLYVSVVFVIVLVVVGGYVFRDSLKLSKGGSDVETTKLALYLQKVKIPPMMHFKTAGVTLSAWVTIPVGLATGMLAATIAVGGFIGVPGMIYVVGASAIVASATELIVAFIMGLWGSVQWGLSGLIDIRLTLLILAGSLFGVQLGALGTTYVKDYVVKVVMGAVMLIVAVSRGAKVPVYLRDLGWMNLDATAERMLNHVSFWALIAALLTAGLIITGAMVKGMIRVRSEERQAAAEEIATNG
ncbi:MAG: sulfite exporter TauE/SafE family protein [Candidatus Sulfobium sp.]|jgi:uncharacterized membrane protein YfcA